MVVSLAADSMYSNRKRCLFVYLILCLALENFGKDLRHMFMSMFMRHKLITMHIRLVGISCFDSSGTAL